MNPTTVIEEHLETDLSRVTPLLATDIWINAVTIP